MFMINGHANMVGFSHAAEFSLIISEIVALFNVIFYMANLAGSDASARQDVTLLIFNYCCYIFAHIYIRSSSMWVCVCECVRLPDI